MFSVTAVLVDAAWQSTPFSVLLLQIQSGLFFLGVVKVRTGAVQPTPVVNSPIKSVPTIELLPQEATEGAEVAVVEMIIAPAFPVSINGELFIVADELNTAFPLCVHVLINIPVLLKTVNPLNVALPFIVTVVLKETVLVNVREPDMVRLLEFRLLISA